MWNRHNVKILLSKEEISVLIEHHQAQADAAWESGEREEAGCREIRIQHLLKFSHESAA